MTSHATWNVFFMLFFLVLIAASLVGLSDAGRLITTIPAFEFFILALATFRLVRLFTYDHITAFLRDDLGGYAEGTLFGTAGRLLACPWCTGMWFGFVVYLGYAAIPAIALPVAYMLAIAAVATVFQIGTNALGWTAEVQKQRVSGGGTPKNTCG